MMMMASREIRRVPRGWEHPEDDALHAHTTEEKQRALYAEHGWNFDEDYPDGFDASRYMPDPGDDYQIMAYETVSEGSPLTGTAFDDTPDGRLALLAELVQDGQSIAGSTPDIEAWAMILFGNGGGALDMQTGAFVQLGQ